MQLHQNQSQGIAELFEFLRVQWFCKYICDLIGHRNVVQFNCTILNFLTPNDDRPQYVWIGHEKWDFLQGQLWIGC